MLCGVSSVTYGSNFVDFAMGPCVKLAFSHQSLMSTPCRHKLPRLKALPSYISPLPPAVSRIHPRQFHCCRVKMASEMTPVFTKNACPRKLEALLQT
jgi:hypothetical protein